MTADVNYGFLNRCASQAPQSPTYEPPAAAPAHYYEPQPSRPLVVVYKTALYPFNYFGLWPLGGWPRGNTTVNNNYSSSSSVSKSSKGIDWAKVALVASGIIILFVAVGFIAKNLSKQDFRISKILKEDQTAIVQPQNLQTEKIKALAQRQLQIDTDLDKENKGYFRSLVCIIGGASGLIAGGLLSSSLIVTAGLVGIVAGGAFGLYHYFYWTQAADSKQTEREQIGSDAQNLLKELLPPAYPLPTNTAGSVNVSPDDTKQPPIPSAPPAYDEGAWFSARNS